MRVQFFAVPFCWSVTNANNPSLPVVQDYIPVPFAQAAYIINFAVLKGHSVGVTLCGKNFYGALLRCPDGYYRDANGTNQGGTPNYSSMHASTPDPTIPGIPGHGPLPRHRGPDGAPGPRRKGAAQPRGRLVRRLLLGLTPGEMEHASFQWELALEPLRLPGPRSDRFRLL